MRPGPRHRASLFGPWGVVALSLAVAMGAAITLGTDHTGVPRPVGFVVGGVVALLTVGALPSFPTNVAVLAVLSSGGFVLLRHAGAPGVDGGLVLVFLVSALATIVLSEHVAGTEQTSLGPRGRMWRGTAGVLGIVIGGVALLAMLFAPLVAAAMHQDVRHGASGDASADTVSRDMLSTSDSMDTRVRPRLSDRIVMTVEADRPAFWRGTTFDAWDGHSWTRRGGVDISGLIPEGDGWAGVIPSPEDPAPERGIASRQTFTIRAPYAQQLFAAATPVRVRSDRAVGQLGDATLVVRHDEALGQGASYTVDSRIPDATVERLRAAPAGPVPRNVVELDLARPTATARLQRLAVQITAGATTSYAKVQAITGWLATHTKYSLDAPLSPRSASDTVDYFVFESRRGWCEQIASTLTVMLRLEGVPARIATGYATGDADALTGRYTVREADAHAWTEVYFPGIGWQGFDPTSRVPLAGDTPSAHTATEWLRTHVLLAIALLVGLGAMFAAASVLRGPLARRRERRRAARLSWPSSALARLEVIGERHRRPRARGETPRAFGAALAEALERPELADVGDAIDRAGFGEPGSLDAFDRTRVDDTLAEALVEVGGRRRRGAQ